MSGEIDDAMKRVLRIKGVVGYIVVNAEGIPVKTTLDNTGQHITAMSTLIEKARSIIRDMEPSNDLEFLRLKSRNHEILVAPDKEFTLIVIQELPPIDIELTS